MQWHNDHNQISIGGLSKMIWTAKIQALKVADCTLEEGFAETRSEEVRETML